MPGKTARSRDQTSFGTAGTPEATAQPTCGFPGNPAVCYRPHCSGVHLGNVGSTLGHFVPRTLPNANMPA